MCLSVNARKTKYEFILVLSEYGNENKCPHRNTTDMPYMCNFSIIIDLLLVIGDPQRFSGYVPLGKCTKN